MIRRKVWADVAPSEAAASSISRSRVISTGCTARTTNGSVTKRSARPTATFVYATSTPTGCLGPYRASSVRPATIVGSANGRSISAFTAPLPRKSSRTSTQAISVPVTALISTTTNEVISVSLNAATDCGVVTTSKKRPSPPSIDFTATAASGSSTITDR